MASIHRRFRIDAPVDQVWARIADVGAVHELFSFLVDATVEGDSRVCKTADGGELRETIVAVDEDAKRLVYTITDSPFGLEFHAGSWRALPDGDGTTFEWFTDLKPDAAAESIAGVIDSEKANIVAALAGETS